MRACCSDNTLQTEMRLALIDRASCSAASTVMPWLVQFVAASVAVPGQQLARQTPCPYATCIDKALVFVSLSTTSLQTFDTKITMYD